MVVRWTWMLAILMPLVCVWGAGSLFWILTERSHVIPQITGTWVINSAMVAVPFCFLAAWEARASRVQDDRFCRSFIGAGALGALCTLVFWGAFYYEGYSYWANRKTSGVNMGAACLMLLSPLAVIAVMVVGRWLFARSSSRRAA